ncbi:MAG: hydrogenase maturation protease [Planctomycetes bacterium]|nr:hydrogenase maturation protease [Planctomycetota bacterium]
MTEFYDYHSKETLVLGCGNILFGDDGFGPAVADYLNKNYNIPENAAVVNLGLSTRGFIFDILLAEKKPKIIVIVDAVSFEDHKPGEIFDVPLDKLCKEKVDDFSFHQGPTSNLLKEMRDICGVEIAIVACYPQNIPQEIMQGLSSSVEKSVAKVSEIIYNKYIKCYA